MAFSSWLEELFRSIHPINHETVKMLQPIDIFLPHMRSSLAPPARRDAS